MDLIDTTLSRSGHRKRTLRRYLVATVAGTALLAFIGFMSSEQDLPRVDRSEIWTGQVTRGTLKRQVRGHGTLVPERRSWVQAETTARVTSIEVAAGDTVRPDDILLVLDSPTARQTSREARAELWQAEAELDGLRLAIEKEELGARARATAIEADLVSTSLKAQANIELHRLGLVSEIQLRSSEAAARAMATHLEIEKELQSISSSATEKRLEAKQAEIAQKRAHLEALVEQLDRLAVRAPMNGIVHEIPVEIGQQVTPGTMLARIASPELSGAEIRVPATRAVDVRPEQPVRIKTRTAQVEGCVTRISPAVSEGMVLVNVSIEDQLPPGCRPEMAIDATITLETVDNVLLIDRPLHCREQATFGLFRLDGDERQAELIEVELGRANDQVVEVLRGLEEGDQVILGGATIPDGVTQLRLR